VSCFAERVRRLYTRALSDRRAGWSAVAVADGVMSSRTVVDSLGDSMSWLIAQVWILLLVAFVLGSATAWLAYRLRPTRGAR